MVGNGALHSLANLELAVIDKWEFRALGGGKFHIVARVRYRELKTQVKLKRFIGVCFKMGNRRKGVVIYRNGRIAEWYRNIGAKLVDVADDYSVE